MNIRNIKIRGALSEIDKEVKARMDKLTELTKQHRYAQVNTEWFDKYVLEADRLVHEIEELRLSMMDVYNRLTNKADAGSVIS